MEKQTYPTNFATAANWLHSSLVLCNEIQEADPSIYDNIRDTFAIENDTEIYQWYLTDCSESDVEFLEEHFGLLFTYSEKLGLYVLCVTHWGTGWDYVYWETDIKNAECKLGETR